MGKKINRDQTVIEKLTHEITRLKRLKFAKRNEQINPEQASLLDDLIDTDIAAIEAELQALQMASAATDKKKVKAQAYGITGRFPRTLIHHEPDNNHCPCGCALKRIGEDVSEKLDYMPGMFTFVRHVRCKWVCDFRINGSWFNHARRDVRTHTLYRLDRHHFYKPEFFSGYLSSVLLRNQRA